MKKFLKKSNYKVVFFCPSIEEGGVEKNLINISNNLSNEIDISLISANENKRKYFQSDKEITNILKNTKHKLENIEKRMQELEGEKMDLLKEKQQILQIAHQVIRESLEEDLARRILYSNLNSRDITDIEELSEILNTREKEIKIIVKRLEDRFSVDLI